MQHDHQHYMHQCIKLAEEALAAGNPPVGAVVVLNGNVIGKGIESGRSTGDVTNHAEILAIKDALKNGYAAQLHLAGIYTTHEPCVMCSYVIRHHKIHEIIYATPVPVLGGATSRFNILTTEDVAKWGSKPGIVTGICLAECEQLNEAFAQLLDKS